MYATGKGYPSGRSPFTIPLQPAYGPAHLVETQYPEGSKVSTFADDIKHFTSASKSSIVLKAESSLHILIEDTDLFGMCF